MGAYSNTDGKKKAKACLVARGFQEEQLEKLHANSPTFGEKSLNIDTNYNLHLWGNEFVGHKVSLLVRK